MNTFLFIDFLGTIIHHETKQALPMLAFTLRRLSEKGWRVVILTSYSKKAARGIAVRAGIPDNLELCSAQNRGQTVRDIIFRSGQGTCRAYYVDDNPVGLKSVAEADIEYLQGRVLGFTGSRRHCVAGNSEEAIASWCQRHCIPLALSPYDILCRLGEYELIDDYGAEQRDLGAEELALLVPGIVHPFSWLGGSARAVGSLLLAHRKDWIPIWRDVGWIGCCECACKLMVRSALRSLEMDAPSILGSAYKAHEHIAAVHAMQRDERNRVVARLKEIRSLMDEGLRQIGPAAEACRPKGAEDDWERDRMQRLDREFLAELGSMS